MKIIFLKIYLYLNTKLKLDKLITDGIAHKIDKKSLKKLNPKNNFQKLAPPLPPFNQKYFNNETRANSNFKEQIRAN